MTEIAERLEQALALSGERSIRAVYQRLKESGYETTYAAVQRYFKGEAEPPLAFLTAVAELLGVRSAWLATGEGEPRTERSWDEQVLEILEERAPFLIVPYGARSALLKLSRDLSVAQITGRAKDVEPGKVSEAHAIADVLLAPFQRLGIEPSTVSDENLRLYVIMTCLGLEALLRPQEG